MKNQKASKAKRILLGVCGSIAAYKICDLVRKLREKEFEVKCILTPSAKEFIMPLTLQTLSNNPVYCGMFGLNLPDTNTKPEHISLADWADLIVIAPATATTISRLANGMADELLSSVVMASKAPVIICPAMNNNMWNHPANKENIKKLSGFGYKFAGPEAGELACGVEGIGRLASIDVILNKVLSALK